MNEAANGWMIVGKFSLGGNGTEHLPKHLSSFFL